MKKLFLIIGVAALALAASSPVLALGANSDNNLRRAVAGQVMQDTHALADIATITLHNVHRTAFSVSWQATTPNGEYACNADDMMRRVQCAHLNKPADTS